MTVHALFQEFRTGRRPFASLIEALRKIDSAGGEGRESIDNCLAGLVEDGLFPNDLAITIRTTLDIFQPAPSDGGIGDQPTERGARHGRGSGQGDIGTPETEAGGVLPPPRSGPVSDPIRNKFDEGVLAALTSDFRRFRRGPDEPAPRTGERHVDKQLDAALARFQGARLRRDAVKSSQGSARSFDFGALSRTEDNQPVAVGSILNNRFVLDREIGRGGMGVVYRAVDRRRLEAMHSQPYVAVKLLHGDFRRDPDALRALEGEARRAQELAHPNIVNTYDFDRDGSKIFIAMELLDGSPLDEILRSAPDGLGFEGSRAIVDSVCAGLAYAHSRGVVHCDLKPANVFVGNSGGVKLLDFGIATAAWASGFDLSSLNAYTIAYASPEILQGEPRDPRDDIYALGCLAYIAVTGRHPFDRASAIEARERAMRPKRPDRLSDAAWRALLRALAFDRARRTRDAAAFRGEYFHRPWHARWFGRA